MATKLMDNAKFECIAENGADVPLSKIISIRVTGKKCSTKLRAFEAIRVFLAKCGALC